MDVRVLPVTDTLRQPQKSQSQNNLIVVLARLIECLDDLAELSCYDDNGRVRLNTSPTSNLIGQCALITRPLHLEHARAEVCGYNALA